MLAVNPAGIPAALIALRQWVVWRLEERHGKQTKVPYCPATGEHASTTDPTTWTVFEAAEVCARTQGYDGVGFVFTADDPYAGIDLDGCIDPETGEIAPWAAEYLELLPTYTERSVRGLGLHLIVEGTLPGPGRKKGAVEMYSERRYFVITGEQIAGEAGEIARIGLPLKLAYEHAFPPDPPVPPPAPPRRPPPLNGTYPADTAVVEKVIREPAYANLWAGRWEGQYKSQSEADLALCGRIAFFTGPDPAAIDRIFKSSRLDREKWDDHQYGSAGSTYGADTVARALAGKTSFYDWDRPPSNSLNSLNSSSSAPISVRETPLDSLNSLNSSDADPEPPPERAWPADLAPEAFHGIAGEIVQAIAPETEADPAALLVNFLVAFGNAVGRGPKVNVLTTRHYANLYGALVGTTGEGSKGSSWDPIQELFTRALPTYTKEQVVGGISSGEGLIWLVRDRIEKRSQIKDKKTGRMTMEFETVIEDEGIVDKRCLVVAAEMTSLLKIMNRPGNVLSEMLREAWDRGDLQNLNKNSSVRATNAHISVLAHLTPSALRQHLTEAEAANGFGNRFLWMLVRRSQYLPEGGTLPYLNNYITNIKSLVELASDKIMARSAEAKAMWAAVYQDLREPVVGMFGELIARRAPIVARLALVYALLDGYTASILPEHLLAALAVWERAEASVYYLFGDATGDPVMDALYEAMRNRPEGAMRTDLHAALGRNRPVAEIDRALSELQRAGKATMRRQKGEHDREVEVWLPGVARGVGPRCQYLEKAKRADENNELNEISAGGD